MIDSKGLVPYQDDDTRGWAESFRVDGKLKPNVVLRIATDTNYILNQSWALNAYGAKTNTFGIMNVAMPGQRLPHVLNWSVNESLDNPVATGNFEILNALQVTSIETTLTGAGLTNEFHDMTVLATYVANSLGVIEKVTGDVDVTKIRDQNNIYFRKDNIKYRQFAPQTFTVADSSAFPDPAVPDDEDGQDIADHPAYQGYLSSQGVGNYFVKIDDEIIRVSQLDRANNKFTVMPGGRQQAQWLSSHSAGAKVQLLGYGPKSGDWAGYGYLAIDDFKPYKCILRPGTALVSYEGYGKFPAILSHDVGATSNYQFTGYWFVKGLEASVGEDGVPKVRVDVVSAGELLNKQKISQDIIIRCKTQFGQWRIGQQNQTIWGAAGHDRNIPGDWVDYDSWDPLQRDAYPLQIKTEFAQNKEFLEHMNDTQFGAQCELCQQELKEWLSTHKGRDPIELAKQYDVMPDGAAKTKLGQEIETLKLLQNRATGRHIYKKSIRVLRETAGPIKTYIRLMATLAAAAWDHPAYGSELAQMFSKIPNKLFDNIRDIYTGLIYNGQVDFTRNGDEDQADWVKQYNDEGIISKRTSITCPFESSYDNAPFYQPMQDLADMNGNTFWVSRKGQPCFMPVSYPLRPYGVNSAEKWEWFLSSGGSISAYSHSLNTDAISTQCWVTGTTAFDSTYTVPSAGTGFALGGGRLVYSPMAGNKEGLALTGGVQQVETISLDNQSLGLDWNTKVENWGLSQTLGSDGVQQMNALPTLYDGSPVLRFGSNSHAAVKRVQNTVNFFLIRRYLPAIVYGADDSKAAHYQLTVDGNYGHLMEAAVNQLQIYLRGIVPVDAQPSPETELQAEIDGKYYGRNTYLWVKAWLDLDSNGNQYIKTDIWWYAYNQLTWEEYVGAMTGVKVSMKPSGVKRKRRTSKQALETPLYVIDDKGMQEAVATWHQTFTRTLVNVGNRRVDDSINKATLRSLSTNLADPRIQPGDVIWAEVPGHLTQLNVFQKNRPPFTNGIYVTQIQRQMDVTQGTYSGSYSGYRFRGDFGSDDGGKALTSGYDFLKEQDK